MSLAYKEGIKIPPPALNEIILASNQDVRQVRSSKRLALCGLGCFRPVTLPVSPGDSQPEHVVGQRQGDDVRPVQVRRGQGPQGHEAGAVRRLQEGVRLGRRDGPHEPHRQVRPLLPRLLSGAALRPGELPARPSSCGSVSETRHAA